MKRMSAVISVAVLLWLVSAGSALAQGTTFDTWAAAASAANTSPITAQTGDQSTSWTSPDGRTISLVVQEPHPVEGAGTVTVATVPANTDARPYFDTAISSARSTGAGKIEVPKATYTFQSLGSLGQGQLEISGLKDVTIDGGGSTFIFQINKNGVYMTQDIRVELTNVIIQYDLTKTLPNNPNPRMMAFLATMSTSAPYTLTVNSPYVVTANDMIGHMTEWNPSTSQYVLGGARVYGPTYTYSGNQSYTSSSFTSSLAGKTFVVFEDYQHYGDALMMNDSPSSGTAQMQDIMIDHVTINSGPGMGIVMYGVKRGVNIQYSAIIPASGALISTEYDAIHQALVSGDVIMQHNQIKGQGDDGINFAFPVQTIVAMTDSTHIETGEYSQLISLGDTLSFFDKANNYLGYTTVVGRTSVNGGAEYDLVLNSAVTGLTTGSFVRDMNLIGGRMAALNNTITYCQCHGILAQLPNMLVQGNAISNTVDAGIRLLTNIGNFQEGTGAINVLVNNNIITSPGADSPQSGLQWAGITLYALDSTGVVTTPSNKYVNITKNTISQGQVGCITVSSSDYVNVTSNQCSNMVGPNTVPSIVLQYANNVSVESNAREGSGTGGISVAASTYDITVQPTY